MKRDALPQHEIDGIVKRLAAGERIYDIYLSMGATVAESWFERNAESLYKLAGVDPERDAPRETIEDVLEKPEPTVEEKPVEDLEDVLGEPEPTEAEVQAIVDREPEARGGKKHRR